jgi:hypothetical protein
MNVSIKKTAGPAPYPGMLSDAQRQRVQTDVARIVRATVQDRLDFAPAGAEARALDAVSAFFSLYEERPVRDNAGGSGFNDSLWLYVLARVFQPRVIVESGVHKGHSTWLFRRACPEAVIHCFDIDLSKLVYRDDKARYFEQDWMDAALDIPDEGSRLVFFDDHISHARRLGEAKGRGFDLALFDDNFPAHHLYATGGPPVPTLAMVMDPDLAPEREIAWTRNGKSYRYLCDRQEILDARALVSRYEVMPELASVTRYSAGSNLSLVKTGE